MMHRLQGYNSTDYFLKICNYIESLPSNDALCIWPTNYICVALNEKKPKGIFDF